MLSISIWFKLAMDHDSSEMRLLCLLNLKSYIYDVSTCTGVQPYSDYGINLVAPSW